MPVDTPPASGSIIADMPVAEKTGVKYRTRFIEPGIISYEDVDMGIVFVGQPALDRMRKTFIGKPVVTGAHYDPENGEEFAMGVVTDVGHEDGWDFADLMIFDEETRQRLDIEGYGVSCAYVPTETAGPGKYHGIEFDAEVLDGTYTHMAIVDSPRYEGSLIYLNSKKEPKRMAIFKLKAGKKPGAKPAEELKVASEELKNAQAKVNKLTNADSAVTNDGDGGDMDDAYVELDNGDRVPLSEMISAYKDRANMVSMDDEIEMDNGEKVPMKELYDAYTARGKKTNAEKPTDTAAEKVVDESKQERGLANSTKTKDAGKNGKDGKKTENFTKVENAASQTGDTKSIIETVEDRLARGKARYSRTVAGGAK